MSQPAYLELAPDPSELVYDDGIPLETSWHYKQITLFLDQTRQAMVERGRKDYFVGGNMFVYYSSEQARDIKADPEGSKAFRGPDYFWVGGVEGHDRQGWVSWMEGGRLPDVIIELSSPSTAKVDRTVKKDLYARVFRTAEYFFYVPWTRKLEGYRLAGGAYVRIVPNAQGRLRSEQLGLELGFWDGMRDGVEATWVRFYHPDGRLVLTETEAERRLKEEERRLKEAERQRAEAERQRADAERQLKEEERQRADAERQRADVERQRAEAECQRADAERQRADAERQLKEEERQRADAAEAELERLRALLRST